MDRATTTATAISTMKLDLPLEGSRSRDGNLNVIPSQPSGGESAGNHQGITSYIEYNDGKVCWYYPIFPDPSTTSAISGESFSFRGTEDNEEYFYEEEDLLDHYVAGDSSWSRENWQIDRNYVPPPPTPQNSFNHPPEFTNQQFYNHYILYGQTAAEGHQGERNSGNSN